MHKNSEKHIGKKKEGLPIAIISRIFEGDFN
jgi:hypothetical protein